MRTHSTSMACPACGGVMEPVAMACRGCELRVEGRFAGNEFARLGAEDLHFLRIFVHCEGRIRDMESALGVSYPTIKARLAGLKGALRVFAGVGKGECEMRDAKCESGATKRRSDVATKGKAGEILASLEDGKMTAEQAAEALRGREQMSSGIDTNTTSKKGDHV